MKNPMEKFMKTLQKDLDAVFNILQEENKIIEEEGMEDISITFADGSSGSFQYPTRKALKRLAKLHK